MPTEVQGTPGLPNPNDAAVFLNGAGGWTVPAGSVSDAVYGAGWNGDTTVAPSKNAVYDKIESLSGVYAAIADAYSAEKAQDDVASMCIDTTSVNVTYTDATPELKFDVLPGGVNHNALLNYSIRVHIGGWIQYDGVTNTISDSYNVSSVTDNGVGDYTVNWDIDFTDANYAVVVGQNNWNAALYLPTTTAQRMLSGNTLGNLVDGQIAIMAVGNR